LQLDAKKPRVCLSMVPGHTSWVKCSKPEGWLGDERCTAEVCPNFQEILFRTGAAGTDGGSGKQQEAKFRKVSSAAAVIDQETGDVAMLFARVPGLQTVPRAELWALINLLRHILPGRHYRVFIDAQYVLNGIFDTTQHYIQGVNGDLWVQVHRLLSALGDIFTFIKVKSHVTTGDDWIKYKMTPEAYLYNNGADSVATAAAKLLLDNDDSILNDEQQWKQTYDVALRISAIEASIWDDMAEVDKPNYGSDFKKVVAKLEQGVKRKLVAAKLHTSVARATARTLTANGLNAAIARVGRPQAISTTGLSGSVSGPPRDLSRLLSVGP
jgi:hypothetical protein